ncbi:hypothetical protein F2P56_034269 [Juglans regia]|uniref:Uncharacterized protein LOC109019946 n=2 Tax=Juglans regia TaxID=51240 RepID=A0A2I4HNZ9_JUGRE|nr:uncharacterized protein LOC109019946 [Juglans regia]KAF5445202.1 hypothetical protein F2P56_034269 [Juglans regia]
MEEIEVEWERLRLNDEESIPIAVDLGNMEELRKNGERSLVGRICSDRTIGKETVRKMMEKICCIMHSKKGCLGGELGDTNEDIDSKQFGVWMRASTVRHNRADRQPKASGMGRNSTNTDQGENGEVVIGGGVLRKEKGSMEGGIETTEVVEMTQGFEKQKMIKVEQTLVPNTEGREVWFSFGEVMVEIINFSQWHINAMVKNDNGKEWLFTGFYGHPEAAKRKFTWELLSSLKPCEGRAWCVAGDFNEILTQVEKKGGQMRPEGHMGMFRDALQINELFDMGYVGDCFTWSNGHADHTFTKERLDRYVANKDWRGCFHLVKVEGLVARSSDHKHLLMTASNEKFRERRRRFLFKFEASWLKEDECEGVVKKVWEKKQLTPKPIKHVQNLLLKCSDELTKGFRKKDRDRGRNIEQLTKRIKELQDMEGPERKKRNRVLFVKDAQSVLRTEENEIAEAFKRHFSEVYRSESPPREAIEECIRPIDKRITSYMNEKLEKSFSREEVEVALRDMGPHKSPGPDGYSACFYQNLWGIVGEGISKAALSFLNGKFEKSLNFTYIALIPKLSEPMEVGDFRPISSCNVLYKLIAKTLANRLKKVLNGVISQNQSAFIPDRLITDNIVAAYEALHSMKTRLKGKMGTMALKLNISEAYDRVEWCYLEVIMVKMGFGRRWINLIMTCITTVSYAVLLNGQPGEAEGAGLIRGVAVARGGVKLSHLLFADDCIIFGRACWEEWVKIRGILQIYERASGQCLNKQKTTIMFSSNGRKMYWERIITDLGARVQNSFEKCLGLPAMVGKSRYDTFRGIKDKVWLRLNNWKNHFLSPAGKEVLLKAVIQSIPIYSRVLHDKYFKFSGLLEAKLGSKPSLIWRSLWGAMNLLKEGLVWRVGNGESIKIWGDRWIPQLSSYKIQSPIKCLNEVDKVAVLIDGEKGEWKLELVKEVFNEVEARIICGLPVSKAGRPDKQIWAPSKSGVFNVKSAYHFEMQRRKRLQGESSSCVAVVDVWAESKSPVQKWPSKEVDFGFVWRKMSQSLSMEELELIAIVLRNIW